MRNLKVVLALLTFCTCQVLWSQSMGQQGRGKPGGGPPGRGMGGGMKGGGQHDMGKRGPGMLAHLAEKNGYPGPMHVLKMADELGLSSKQLNQLRKLRDTVYLESTQRKDKIHDLTAGLERLFAGQKANEGRVRKVVQEIGKLQGEIQMIHLTAHLKTKNVLTQEQLGKYAQMRGERGPGGRKGPPRGRKRPNSGG